VRSSAVAAGRDVADVEISTKLERALPETDAESAEFLDLLGHRAELGVQHFVLDFGHPLGDEHVIRFVEQVMAPLRVR
jgi:hypothetical protein